MKHRPYPSYINAESLWTDSIPSQWDIKQVKHLFSLGRGRVIAETELDHDGKYPVYSSQTQNDGCMGYIKSYDFDCEQLTWTTDGANAGTVFLRNGKHNCTNVCGTLKPINNDGFSLRFYLHALSYITQFYKRPDTNGAKIMNGEMAVIKVPSPPIQEQNKISEFLDRETAKLNTLITKQEKLIELLQEKRQAIISHAVTKGLDPNVRMKDSGVEWLGMVPEHWEVLKGKKLFDIAKRIAGKLGYDVLSITQKGIKVKDVTSGDGQLSMDYSKYQLVQEGDFAMNHMDLLTGFVDISKFNGVTSPDYRVFKLKDKFKSLPEYYLFILQNCYTEKLFFPYGQGSSQLGRWRLPTEAFNYFNYPSPPYEEQLKIVQFLKDHISRIDTLITKSESSIELAKEHRTALISAAVTGKIDVRDYA
ncbi:MAG: restriction endonuclease [Methylotenera sp.]|nr:MAG: restriction endonuclease [Methylotenera sp.]